MMRRRIAYMLRATAGVGGSELNFIALLRQLDRQRFDPLVYLYCSSAATGQWIRDEAERLGVPVHPMDQDGVPLPQDGTAHAAAAAQAAVAPEAYAATARPDALRSALLSLAPSGVKVAWHYRKRIREASRLLRAARIDIMHFVHGGYPSLSIPMIASRRAGIPVRIADVLLDPRSARSRDIGVVRGVFAWQAGRCMTHVRAMSQQMKRKLVRLWGIRSRQIVVISNWVDWGRFHAADDPAHVRRELGIPEGAALVCVVARLSPEKGHRVLLQAAACLHIAHPDVHYLLLGEGPLRQQLQAQAVACGLQERAHFLGFRQDIPRLLAASDVAVLPSFVEGVPAAILEAMASGLPVIATDVGGVREVLIDGAMGRIISPGNAGQLTQALEQLLRAGHEQRQAMGRRAQDHVRTHFSLEQITASIFALYEGGRALA